jgi:uncharacterized protein
MKFQPDTLDGVNVITRHEPQQLWVGNASGNTRHARSLLVPWRGAVQAWDVDSFEALRSEHFEQMLALAPEVVILGTGARLRFPAAALMRALIARRIGIESMDTAAASRTYNVLANEGRSVLGAFVIDPGAAGRP